MLDIGKRRFGAVECQATAAGNESRDFRLGQVALGFRQLALPENAGAIDLGRCRKRLCVRRFEVSEIEPG